MKPAAKRKVETVEEFKLRIAAIIGAKPEHIPAPPRPHPLLVRRKKHANHQKAKRRTTR
jgi:hypothetical protein